jgi:uncharacterized protein (TIGR02001 family)
MCAPDMTADRATCRSRRARPGCLRGLACAGLLGLPPAAVGAEGGTALPDTAMVPAPPAAASPWSWNIGLYSQYVSRGLSYTHERPAVQGGGQYSDPSGWYLGLWITNVSDAFISRGTVETDPYGGYAGSAGDFSYDIGFWRWTFIGASLPVSRNKYDTIELYVGVGWKSVHVKCWRELTDYFGLNNGSARADAGLAPSGGSGGSIYLEANWDLALPREFAATLHAGRQSVHGYPQLSFSEYRFNLDKDLGRGWMTGVSYNHTDANPLLYMDLQGLSSARPKWVGYLKKTF